MDAQTFISNLLANAKKGSKIPEALELLPDHYMFCYVAGVGFRLVKKSNISLGGETITSLKGLSDTPNSYLGQKGKILVVKQDETGLEYKVLAEVTGVTEQQLNDAVAALEAQIAAIQGGGNTTSSTKLISIIPNWEVGTRNLNPTGIWVEENVQKTDSRPLTVAAADPALDRYDLLGINLNTDQLEIITGQAADPALEPEYDPLTFLPGPFISMKAGTTAPENVVGVNVWTEGAEWSTAGAGPDFDFANTESVASGTYAIKAINPLTNSQALPFTAPIPKAYEEGMELAYKIKNISGGIYRWLVAGTKANGRQTSVFIDAPFNYSSTSLVYQPLSVVIPSGIFAFITKTSLVSGQDGFQYFLDDVKLVSGSGAVSGNYVTLYQFNDALALKVDKIAGKGLSTEDYTTAEKTKLANIVELHKGSYPTITALRADFPEGAGQNWHQNRGGWTGDVDAGTDAKVVRYLWDASDFVWRLQQGETTAETAESIATKYHSNAGIEAFTTILKNKLDSITEIFTTALKASYDTAASWVSTNGANVLSRLGVLEREPITVSTSRLLAATDHNRVLLITAAVTLTYPAGGLTPFKVNFDVDSTGTLTIADQSTGTDLDAPDGKILEAGKMAHAYKRPDNIKLRLKGTWKV